MPGERASCDVTTTARVLGAGGSGPRGWPRPSPGGGDPWAAPREAAPSIRRRSRGRFGLRKVRAGSLLAAWAGSHDVRPSVGGTGSCHDNAVAWPFFGSPKNEWSRHERLRDAETTRRLATEPVEPCHDRCRPHGAIGDRVPAEVMDEFLARLEEGMSHDPEAVMAA